MWYSTRAKQSKAEQKVFPSINLEEQEEEICWTWKGTFKFTEVTAHSGLQYPPPLSSCLILPPTCRLWHLCLLLPHFFHCTLVHVQVLALQQRVSSKPLKHTPPRKSLYLRLLQIEALIKPLLESPKQAFYCPQKKDLVILSGIK